MSRKTVIISTCDRCSLEAEQPFNKTPLGRGDRYVLPVDWIHVQGDTARTTVFEMDLCPDCARVVREAAGMFRP